MSELYRLVYTSKNLMVGSEAAAKAAVIQILETSRRNNTKVGVTGALMFNGGAFAQVLEGPRRSVEQTFERIQRDSRHGDVTVLQCGPVESRGFTNWSMAFVGQSARGLAMWSGLAAESGFDPARVDGDAVFSMLHGLVLEEEDVALANAQAANPGALPAMAPSVPPGPEAKPKAPPARVGAEQAVTPPAQGSDPARGQPRDAAETAFAVLKAALAAERQRTTDLRDEVDALQIALAEGRAQREAMQAERDLWAERARVLAGVLYREAAEAGSALRQEVRSAGGPEFANRAA